MAGLRDFCVAREDAHSATSAHESALSEADLGCNRLHLAVREHLRMVLDDKELVARHRFARREDVDDMEGQGAR